MRAGVPRGHRQRPIEADRESAAASLGQAGRQRCGNNSSMRRQGLWMGARTSLRYAQASSTLSLSDCTRLMTTAARWPASSLALNNQFFDDLSGLDLALGQVVVDRHGAGFQVPRQRLGAATEAVSAQASTQEGRGDDALLTKTSKQIRRRDRGRTLEELRLAIARVKSNGKKLSISAVAIEAGVTPGLIHNTYPDLAETIREQVGKATRKQRDDKIAELSKARKRIKESRVELKAALSDIQRLASTSETLRQEVAKLRAAGGGKVVFLPSLNPGNR